MVSATERVCLDLQIYAFPPGSIQAASPLRVKTCNSYLERNIESVHTITCQATNSSALLAGASSSCSCRKTFLKIVGLTCFPTIFAEMPCTSPYIFLSSRANWRSSIFFRFSPLFSGNYYVNKVLLLHFRYLIFKDDLV